MPFVRHLMEGLLDPFFLVLLLFMIFLVFLWFYLDNLVLRIVSIAFFFLLLVLSSGWLVEHLTRELEMQYRPITVVNPNVQWVVVLSGGQAQRIDLPTNAILSGISIKRLLEGIRVYHQLPHAKLLLSGGGYGFEVSEASHLSELAFWLGIPAGDLVLETESINTEEQMKAIRQWVHNKPFYLVTSAMHMPRSLCLSKAYGLHPIPAPTDYTLYWYDEDWPIRYLPNAHNLFYLKAVMHEFLGRGWAKLSGAC